MNKLDELNRITLDYYGKLGEVYTLLETLKDSLPAPEHWWDDTFPFNVYRERIECIENDKQRQQRCPRGPSASGRVRGEGSQI